MPPATPYEHGHRADRSAHAANPDANVPLATTTGAASRWASQPPSLAHRQCHVRGLAGPSSPPPTPCGRWASILEVSIPVTRASLVSQLGRWRERSCACSLLQESVIQRSCHDQSETSPEATRGLQGTSPKDPHRSRWRRSRADVGRDSMRRQFRQYQFKWKGDLVPVFVKVVEASGSYAAGSFGSGGLIQAAPGR